jgi:alkylation response protein AidB-like acyl-CoA dehydrogenase
MNALPLPRETPDYTAAKAFGQAIPAPSYNFDSHVSLRETWKNAAEFGLFELLMPRGRLLVKRVLATLEGLGEGCENGGFLLALGAHCFGVGAPLAHFGNDQQNGWLSSLRNGKAVAALAATEPEAGSDVMSLGTRFWKDGDNYVIHGTKCYITNVREADLFLVLATKDPRLHFRGVSAFLVPRNTVGLVVGTDQPRLGLHGCSVGTLVLDKAIVHKSSLLGRLGNGAAVFGHAMMWERSLIVVAQVGIMRRQLLYCLSHAKTRRQFGRAIGTNQYVAGRIVDLLARYTTSRLLARDTVAKLAMGKLTPGEASLTKMYVSEAAFASSMDAFRLHGGSGFMNRSPAAVELGNSLGGIIYSGTSDLQKIVIASALGLVD